MLARYRRFEKRMGWEEQPLIIVVVGWAMFAEGVLFFTTAATLKILGIA